MSSRVHVPVRTCVGCGERDAQGTLVRVQVAPDGTLRAVERPQGGRSAYVHAHSPCIVRSARGKLFNRSLRVATDATSRAALATALQGVLNAGASGQGQQGKR